MRAFWIISAFGFIFLSSAHAEREIGVESKTTNITVYEDRAMVTRTASLSIEKGKSELILAGLPALIQDNSVRASGKGEVRVTILGVDVERKYLKEPRDERVLELQRKIEEMEDRDTALQDKLKALDLQLKFLEAIGASTGERISQEMLMRAPDPEGWKGVVSFLGAESSGLYPASRETERERKDLLKEIEALKKTLEQIISQLPKEQKDVTVAVLAEGEGTFELELSYMVGNANWRPVYDVRSDREGREVVLLYNAEVRQKSGEDWNDVLLELSTATPSLGGTPPELRPWYISFHKYRPVERRRDRVMAKVAAPMLAETAMEPEAEELEYEAEYAGAEVSGKAEAITFNVKNRETIPGDNSLNKVSVSSEAFDADYSYLAVPKLVEKAFLLAAVKNVAPYPLLDGVINIFKGPEYIGTSTIKRVAPGEEFDIYLGADDGVTVKRELVEEEAERSLVRRKTGWKSYSYRVEVENHRDKDQTVIVLDQIPVSKEPDIQVSLEKVEPKEVKIPKYEIPGGLGWKLTLGPGEKRTIGFKFTVSYPKEKELWGIT